MSISRFAGLELLVHLKHGADLATVLRPEEDYSRASVLSQDGDVVGVIDPALEQCGHGRLDVFPEVDALGALAQVTVFEFGAGAVEVEAYRVEILDEAVDNPHLFVVVRAIQPLFIGLYQPSLWVLDEEHKVRWVHGLADIHRPIEGPALGIVPLPRGPRFERGLQSRQILTHAGPQPIRGEEAVRQLAGVKLIFDFESVVADLVLNLLEAYEVKHFGPGRSSLLRVPNGGEPPCRAPRGGLEPF